MILAKIWGRWVFRDSFMASHQKQFSELTELVEKLNKDRAWTLNN